VGKWMFHFTVAPIKNALVVGAFIGKNALVVGAFIGFPNHAKLMWRV